MPKVSASKQTQATAQKQPKPTPLLPPPPGFEYQAFGFLSGELIIKGADTSLLVDGQSLVVSGINERVQRWLATQEGPITGYFGLYPKSTRGGVTFWLKSFEAPELDIESGTFQIHGQLVSTKGGTQLIRIHRNRPTEAESPFFVKVSGFLPSPKPGQFWQLECVWEDSRFVLVDGDRFQAPAA